MMLTCVLMQTNHSAFGLDVDIILNALHLPLPPVGPSIRLIAVDILVCSSIVAALSSVILTTSSCAFSERLMHSIAKLVN